MAENPFAQFARPQRDSAANPFAQFAAPAPAPAPRAPEMPPMEPVEPSYASSMPDIPLEQEPRLPRMSARDIASGAAATGQAFGEGVIAGIPGVVGDIESLGRTAVNQLQRPEILRRALGVAGPLGPLALGASRIGPVEQETAFPTSGEVARGVFGESEAPAGETIREVGSIFSPLGTVARGIGRAGRAVLESPLVGRPTAEQARVAAEAERAGIRVRPRQVRETEPGTEMLDPVEQRQINREANRAIGIDADAFDSAAVQRATRRFDDEYRRLYGTEIKVDEEAADIFQQIIRDERALDPAGSYRVAATARNFFARFQEAQREAAEQAMLLQLQRQRTQRTPGQFIERTFGPNERIDAPDLTQDVLRELRATDLQNVRPITAADAPEWAPQVNSVINELVETLGLRVRPKVYVGQGGSAYAWASPTGHIFINEQLIGNNARGALATALHEFGHMVEFQLLAHAPRELQTAIRKAYAEQTRASRAAGATIEQLRPVTAEKYDPISRARVPTSAKEVEYFHGFQEWFAEQVSRWMTQTKEPVTMVEKFFAKVADFWKAIYQRVAGYTGLVQPMDQFMRSNFNGKLINDTLVQRIYQAPEVRGGAAAPAGPARPAEPVVARMPGEEVRRLRSSLADFASRTQDGNMAFAARELVKRIDGMIERSNPQVARQLQRVNQQYRAFMDLRELRRTNAGDMAVSGNVSPQAVGRLLAANEALVAGARRATAGRVPTTGQTHPLRRIGEYGMQLGFRSRTEGAEAKADALNYLLTRPMRWLRTGLSPAVYPYELGARAVQRRMRPGGPPTTVTPRAATEVARGAAAGGRAVTEREE